MALNDFDYIKTKIRRITGRTDEYRLTEDELIDYINSFLVYDLPLHTRYFYNRQEYSFQLTPNISVYSIEAIKNTYSNFEPPVYIDGQEIRYFQNEQAFFNTYPKIKYSATFATGTAAIGAGPYAGTFSYTPIQPESVVISTLDINDNSLLAIDDGTGGFNDENGTAIFGATIDYETGVIAGITFTAAVNVGETIHISANNYTIGKPLAMLYFNNEFKFWPFPDKAYTCKMIAYPNPAETIAAGGALFPELNQWADVIALGTSLKIFTDNLDIESYNKINILFDTAKNLAERRTLKQLSTQRVSTIYDGIDSNYSGWYGY